MTHRICGCDSPHSCSCACITGDSHNITTYEATKEEHDHIRFLSEVMNRADIPDWQMTYAIGPAWTTRVADNTTVRGVKNLASCILERNGVDLLMEGS
jgi:hypothetical protein